MKCLPLIFCCFLFSVVQPVFAQTVAIPDTAFEQLLIDLDIDSDSTINGQILASDASGVQSLDFTFTNTTDLTGIEAFTDLDSLTCLANSIDTLNLEHNVGLTFLSFTATRLVDLDLSKNVNLEHLTLHANQFLQRVNLKNGNNYQLTHLFAFDNDDSFMLCVDDSAYIDTVFAQPYWNLPVDATLSESCIFIPTHFSIVEQNEAKISVFPTPSNNLVHFEIGRTTSEDFWLQIMDLNGQVLLQKHFSDRRYSLQRNNLPAGLYFYSLRSKDRILGNGKIVLIE